MDFIDLERQFETLSRDCFLKLTEAEQKLREEIEKKFQTLEGSFEIESAVLDKLESEIEKEIQTFQDTLAGIKTEIQALESKKEVFNVDSEAMEDKLVQETEAKLQPYLSAQKKKRTELVQKISELKKELANFHKENNLRLIEEEKQFKAREAELDRRLSIDLERENDANIEAYSEFEKKLLATNDDKEIEELKNKIKSIRILAVREQKKIKDQYAYSHFENRLDFRKFSEKIILENSLKGEETKFQVQALESEKDKLEQETESEKQKAAFEIQKALLDYERDQKINYIKAWLDRELKIVALEKKALEIESLNKEKQITSGENFRKEALKFDLSNLETYAPLRDVFFTKFSQASGYLINALQAYVKLCKDALLSLLQEFNEESKRAHDRFKNFLLIAKRDALPKGGPGCKQLLLELTKLTEESFRKRRQMYEQTEAVVAKEITEILIHINNINTELSNQRAQLKDHEENYFRNLKDLLENGYRELEEKAEEKLTQADKPEFKKREVLVQKEADRKNAEVLEEYNRKLEKLKAENAGYFESIKKEEQKRLQDERAFVKKSKKRTHELKKNYTALIAQSEKQLYAEYQNELEENISEEKERIKEL